MYYTLLTLDFKLDYVFTSDYIRGLLNEKELNFDDSVLRLLKKAENLVHEYSISNSLCSGFGNNQYYTFISNTLAKDNFFSLTWDIEKLKAIIAYKQLSPVHLSVSRLSTLINSSTIEQEFLAPALKNNEPILVGYLPFANIHVIIDGNHRVMSRQFKGINTIKGFTLNPEDYFFAMPDDTSRSIFYALTTIKTICDYLVGNETKENLLVLEQELENFYDLSAEKQLIDMLDGN